MATDPQSLGLSRVVVEFCLACGISSLGEPGITWESLMIRFQGAVSINAVQGIALANRAFHPDPQLSLKWWGS